MWIAFALALAFLVAAIHVIFPKKYQTPREWWHLRKIPGLPQCPYFGNYQMFTTVSENFLETIAKICDTYKPLAKIEVLGITHVFPTDINDLQMIFNSRKHITKSDDYEFLLPWLGTGLLTSTGKKWFEHRKLLTPAFHFQILMQYIDVLNKNAKILIEQLRSHAESHEVIEINPLISLCTLDNICETAMGITVDAQIGGEKEYVKATLRMSHIFQRRLVSPWLYRPWLFSLSPSGREQKKLLKILHGFAEKVIRERKDIYRQEEASKKSKPIRDEDDGIGAKERMSFLDLLIAFSNEENKMTDEEIREEVDTFMFEGHDTTAAAISWTLFELGHNPEIQERAYQEQCTIFRSSKRAVTSADLQKMKYLERVMKETLRLYPSVPFISRRLETDVTIKNYVIPAGTNIPAFIYYIHRDPTLYPDPLKFDPDRFLPDKVQNRHPYAYIPFSTGSRNCIGQKFAEMEEKVVLSSIIRNFQVTSLDKRDDIKMLNELILRPKRNLRIAFKARK